MTDEQTNDDVVVEDEVVEDVVAEDEVLPFKEPHVEIPYRKMVIGVTNKGLITLLLCELSVLEQAEVGRQLAETARANMVQQSAAFNKAVADGTL